MKNYLVSHPITGQMNIVIEAPDDADKHEIGELAVEKWSNLSPKQQRDCVEWEFIDRVAYGNVCSAMLNDLDWSETSDEPDEPATPSKAKLWRRVARLAGELTFFHPNEYLICEGESPLDSVKKLVDPSQHFETSREQRIADRLKIALAAWEAAQ